MPSVKRSLYFHRDEQIQKNTPKRENISDKDQVVVNEQTQIHQKSPLLLLWSHFRNAYTNPFVLQWSIWYAVGFCGYLQVTYYVQVLWKDIEPNPSVFMSFVKLE